MSIKAQTEAAINAKQIDVECPKCSHKSPKTIGWLRTNRLLRCAGCGDDITIDTTRFEADIQPALNEASKIDQTLARISKLTLKF